MELEPNLTTARTLTDGRGEGGGGGGAKFYDGEKAWSSINNLILFGPPLHPPPPRNQANTSLLTFYFRLTNRYSIL